MKIESEIFISYAWGDKNEKGESRETIVDQLYDSLTEKGFKVIRDKVSLGYGGKISDFMERIGKGKYVIVVISDKYLKSEFCMYEIRELLKNKDYRDRIFPIILSDANIFNELNRLEYLDYWSLKKEALQARIRHLKELQDAQNAHSKLKLYDDIREIIGEFTGFIKDVNSLTPDMHSGSNFKELIKFIEIQQLEDELSISIQKESNKPENRIENRGSGIRSIGKETQVSARRDHDDVRGRPRHTPTPLTQVDSVVIPANEKKKQLPIAKIAGIIGVLLLGVLAIFGISGGEEARIGKVLRSDVNVRNQPSTENTQVVGKVNRGDEVKILASKTIVAKDGEWILTKPSTIYFDDGKMERINRGKAVRFMRFRSSKPGMARVEIELVDRNKNRTLHQVDINAEEIKKLEDIIWFKISTPEFTGWIFGEYLAEQ